MYNPGDLFAGEWRIRSMKKRGGMATVYEVEQVSTGRARALKLLHPFVLRDPTLRERFVAEARVP